MAKKKTVRKASAKRKASATTKRKTTKKKAAKRTTKRKTAAKKTTKRKATPTRRVARSRPAAMPARSAVAPVITVARTLRLDSYALAYTVALVGAIWVLVVSILANFGVLMKKAQMMSMALPFYAYGSVSGVVIGMAMAAIYGLLTGLVAGWLYNKFS